MAPYLRGQLWLARATIGEDAPDLYLHEHGWKAQRTGAVRFPSHAAATKAARLRPLQGAVIIHVKAECEGKRLGEPIA